MFLFFSKNLSTPWFLPLHQLLTKALVQVDASIFPFQQHLKVTNNSLPSYVHAFFPLSNLLINKFNFGVPNQSIFLAHFSEEMPNAHWTRILSCFGLGVNGWFPMQNVFPMFLLVFYNFLHDALNLNKTPLSFSFGPSSMCLHPTHWPNGYPPFTNNKYRNSNTYFHNKMPMET